MSAVGEMIERKERPAYVRFERRPVEDRSASEREGRYVARDEDYALITPPYSRDVMVHKVKNWLAKLKQDLNSGRLPREWYERYIDSYERWKKGEEIPLNGTPIKGWAVISPAQQANLVAMNILTVEDLSAVNDEGIRRIGMGGGALRDKARAWLSQAKDKGPLTMENAALKSENQTLKSTVESLERSVKDLSEKVDILQRGGLVREQHFERTATDITASDILEAEPKRRPGRPKKADQQPEQTI